MEINSEKLKSGNGNFKNNSGRFFWVGNVFVAHGRFESRFRGSPESTPKDRPKLHKIPDFRPLSGLLSGEPRNLPGINFRF